MDKDTITTFTLRITSSNGTGLIAVLFDIYLEYENEASEAFGRGDFESFTKALKNASQVIEHLQKDLNFHYEISKNLYALYDFAKRSLAKSIYKNDLEGMQEAKIVMDGLGESFREVAQNDKSRPLMQNTQRVMAGYTYGRTSLNENLMDDQSRRGFWA